MSTAAATPLLPRAARGRRRVRPTVAVALAVAALLLLMALCPGLLAHQDPNATETARALRGPSLDHLLGTDRLGRDVFSRVVHGARTSLAIGLGATAIGLLVGSLVGALAGFGPRLVDGLLMRVIDVLAAIPELLLALVAIVVLGSGSANVAAAIGVASIPNLARLVRAQVLVLREAEFVVAARTLGRGPAWLVLRHVLPNAVGPVLALAAISTGSAVVAGAGLSYLGFGPGPPSPEWGSMLVEGQDVMQDAPWTVLFPGLAVATVVLCASVLGRELRGSDR
ncbi:ABC transporter permease [Patulibacter defluvii]|uniref:ABC transporter permease n=1 Tax=Patulibacter defluvii TaxID=3095358 RepID=UPI002A757B43|nr:ABC transporter permease [Patulibacter sp. DM4]